MDIPWVNLIWEKHYRNGRLPNQVKKGSYWWRDILKLLDKYKGLAKVDLRNGTTCLFWTDMWLDQIPSLSFPELFSFSKKKSITFQRAMTTEPLHNLFHLPLSEPAYDKLLSMEQILNSVELSHEPDSWSYIWGNLHFSSTKAYRQLT
jgi:hypothetical protein